MPITIVTIDFWNTLFNSEGGDARNEQRRNALREAIVGSGHECDEERLHRTYAGIWEYFDHHWLEHHRTPTTAEMISEICRRLDIGLASEWETRAAEIFCRGVLAHPPELLPGVHEGLAFLADRARLALISDTAFSPGSVLRELMARVDIDRYFSAWVFSDETGVAKPHPEAFSRALGALGGSPGAAVHIGDIERTDIRGAKAAGMRAILYKGNEVNHKYAEEATAADAVMNHWNEIPEIFAGLSGQEKG